MATYKEIKVQLAEINELVMLARAAEFEIALADIRAKVVEFGFTEEEIFRAPKSTPKRRLGRPFGYVVPPKYRNPATGATWSGRGKTP